KYTAVLDLKEKKNLSSFVLHETATIEEAVEPPEPIIDKAPDSNVAKDPRKEQVKPAGRELSTKRHGLFVLELSYRPLDLESPEYAKVKVFGKDGIGGRFIYDR